MELELVARPLLFAALMALAFAPLEHLLAAHRPTRTRFATDLGFATAGQVMVQLGTLLLGGALLARVEDFAIDSGLDGLAPRTAWMQLLLGLLLFELGGYAYHRMAHALPLLWRLHQVHHSSRDMDWLAAFRQHPLEVILMTVFQNAPLVLLGIPLGSHALLLGLLRLHTVFLHANLRIAAGPWDHLIAMPTFHQRHHALHGEPCNYASLFPFLDRLFGSHRSERAHLFGAEGIHAEGFWRLLLAPLSPRRSRRSTA
jgi:sterol desaturase/sphingolipid hydroxylase (fatty acid hydroxylase superfamily)